MAVVTVDPKAHPNSPTSGIQEAMDALPPEGGTVFIPAGVYAVRCPIFPKPKSTLRGEGEATVLVRPAAVTTTLTRDTAENSNDIHLDDVAGLQVGDAVAIRDFVQGGWHKRHLLIRKVGGNAIDGEAFDSDLSRTYTIEEKAWLGNFFAGVFILETHGVTIESLVFSGGDREYDMERAGDFTCAAVHTRRSRDVRVREVTVRNWPADGIGIQGGNGTVTGCVVEGCTGIGLHPGTNINHSVWMGNISRNNRHGLLFCQGVKNTVVANNVILGNKEHGIFGLADPDKYNVVAGNICSENGWYGIEAWKSVGNAIVGNMCRSNSRAMPGNYSGILVEKHQDNTVVGNVCVDDLERPTQLRGIESVDPVGENVVQANRDASYSGYMRSWEKQEKAKAEHDAEKEPKASAKSEE